MTEEEISEACVEYGKKLEELNKYVSEVRPKVAEVRNLAENVKAIKMVASKGKPAKDSPELRAAMAEAKSMSQKFGPTSPEARVAWTEVEEIAATGNDNALGRGLDEECLVDSAMEACQAIEELNNALNRQDSVSKKAGGDKPFWENLKMPWQK